METETSLSTGMESHTCEIPMKLPSMNEYIRVCRRNRYESAEYKMKLEEDIGIYLKPLKRFKKPVLVHFTWHEKDMRRDADNIAFAKKFILDAMVKKGILHDDSRKYVTGFTDTFRKGDTTKVVIVIEEA